MSVKDKRVGKLSVVTISEARLNDMAYMVLKKTYFEHIGLNPRECDIRIVMDMAVPGRIKSVAQAILLPDEVAPKSHDIEVEVDPGHLFDVAIDYIEEHWIKGRLGNTKWRANARRTWLNAIVPSMLSMAEEDCGG